VNNSPRIFSTASRTDPEFVLYPDNADAAMRHHPVVERLGDALKFCYRDGA
jgi:hypothetical protein